MNPVLIPTGFADYSLAAAVGCAITPDESY